MDVDACSDGELVALVLAGRRQIFATLMKRHKEPIFRLVMGHVGNADDALDLVQESFVAAYRNLERYDDRRPFRPWLARIAINKCRDWARKRSVRQFFIRALSLDSAGSVPDPAPTPEAKAEENEATTALWRLIAALPPALKEPLLLCAIDGLSHADAALALGISPKAVETRLYRARARLAEALKASPLR